MAVSQIYDFGGHLDHATDIDVYTADHRRRRLAAAARAEELAIYGGATVPSPHRVAAGAVRNRTQRGA